MPAGYVEIGLIIITLIIGFYAIRSANQDVAESKGKEL